MPISPFSSSSPSSEGGSRDSLHHPPDMNRRLCRGSGQRTSGQSWPGSMSVHAARIAGAQSLSMACACICVVAEIHAALGRCTVDRGQLWAFWALQRSRMRKLLLTGDDATGGDMEVEGGDASIYSDVISQSHASTSISIVSAYM